MAVAFTREEDIEAAAAHLPDRPVSPHRNFVTREGLAAIDDRLRAAQASYVAAQASGDVRRDRTAMAQAARDLRYYRARRASAELIALPPSQRVQFGSTVEILREDGLRLALRIVGEDEADILSGSVSYVSPMAKALMGKSVGDEATVVGRALEVIAIG